MAVADPLAAVNSSNLEKIESFLNDSAYREALESSANYNTRLCVERRLRMPFLDSQTGVAQNHSALFMSKRQRLPGLHPGQIYSYPRSRWRKRRRQYLSLHSRSFARAADSLLDQEGDLHSISQVENPALQDTDSKDSQLHKDEVSKEWFFDDHDMLELEGYDEPDGDSDFDYEESYSKRRKARKNAAKPRGVDSPNTPRRGKGSGRGRKKANHSYDPMPGDPDKPFGCELCGARYKTRPGLTYHYSHSHRDGASDENSRDSVVPAPLPSGSTVPVPLTAQNGQIAAAINQSTFGLAAGLMGGALIGNNGGGPCQPPPPLHFQGMGGSGFAMCNNASNLNLNTSLLGGVGVMGVGGDMGVGLVVGGVEASPGGQLDQQSGPTSPGHVYQDSYVTFLNHPTGTPTRRGRHPNNPNPSNSNAPPLMPPTPPLPPAPGPLIPPPATPPTLPPNPLPVPLQLPADDPPMPVLIPEKKIKLVTEILAPEPQKEKAAPSPYCDFCLGDARENKKTGTSEELVSCSDCGRSGKARLDLDKTSNSKKGRKKKTF